MKLPKPPIIGKTDHLKDIVDEVTERDAELRTADHVQERPGLDLGLKGKTEHRAEGGCGCGGKCGKKH